MALQLELPAELEREVVAYATFKQVDLSNIIITSLSEFLARQKWGDMEKWLAEGPSSFPVEWQTDDLDELLAGISEENLHQEVDFGSPVGQEVW